MRGRSKSFSSEGVTFVYRPRQDGRGIVVEWPKIHGAAWSILRRASFSDKPEAIFRILRSKQYQNEVISNVSSDADDHSLILAGFAAIENCVWRCMRAAQVGQLTNFYYQQKGESSVTASPRSFMALP